MYWKIKKAIYGLERDGVDSAVLTVKPLPPFLNLTIKLNLEKQHTEQKSLFRKKNLMFTYLVENHNVILFGIEAYFAACYDINKYVTAGEGNAKEAL